MWDSTVIEITGFCLYRNMQIYDRLRRIPRNVGAIRTKLIAKKLLIVRKHFAYYLKHLILIHFFK